VLCRGRADAARARGARLVRQHRRHGDGRAARELRRAHPGPHDRERPWGLGFGARRITVSTSGLVPKIIRLADEPLGFRLAISLHGATDEVRTRIMPVNKAYPLAKLLPAVRTFSERHGRMVTLEFILIEDVNDSMDQARRLRDIALDLHAHVNLIPYNTVEGLPWKRPEVVRQLAFADILERAGVSVTLRREKGHDIAAACGQLRLKTERERGDSRVAAEVST
jgi:23S rRNA (adenine2503-C2)-methyltransferase